MLSFLQPNKKQFKEDVNADGTFYQEVQKGYPIDSATHELYKFYAELEVPVVNLHNSRDRFIRQVIAKRDAAIQRSIIQNRDQQSRSQLKWTWKFALVAVVFTLLFFPVRGHMVVSAMDSLPGDTLYLVKLVNEDKTVDMVEEPAVKALLALSFADKRIEEMIALAHKDREIPITSIYRAHDLINTALNYASWTDDDVIPVLEKISRHLQTYAYQLDNAKSNATELNQSRLSDMRGRCLRLQLIVTAASLESDMFREAYQLGAPEKLTALNDPLGADAMSLE